MTAINCRADPPIRPRTIKEFPIKHLGIFTIGDEEHECELEGWIACDMDGDAVEGLRPLKEQTVYRFMPILCGVELLGVMPNVQRELFVKCFATELGRRRLIVLCQRANGEMV